MNEGEIRKLDELKLRVTEYEQLSADWRHRDSLTWQMPAALLVIAGVLVAEGFGLLDNKVNPWVAEAVFAFAAAFAVVLNIALQQNLDLQGKNGKSAKAINPCTQRFGFSRHGSWSLFGLSCGLCVALLGLNFITVSSILCPTCKLSLLNLS